MAIDKQTKAKLVKEFGKSEKDTGSSEVQIAILTNEINAITSHLAKNKKDFSGKRGLYKKVSKRRSLLEHLKKNDIERYRKIIKKLDLRN